MDTDGDSDVDTDLDTDVDTTLTQKGGGPVRRVDGRVVLSATDLTKHVACAHVTTLDLAELDPQPPLDAPVPDGPDDALDLVFAKGLAHERAYLQRLREEGRGIETVEGFGVVAAAQTMAAMQAGADVVYQACLARGSWLGHADFLLRVDVAEGEPGSVWGPWRYDLADTKLARRLSVAALLQMATYAEHLTATQGVPPQRLVVVSGDGVEHAWAPRDVRSYARRVARRLERAVATGAPTQAAPIPHCKQCRWSSHCSKQWEAADDVGLVAGVRRDLRRALRARGIATVAALADTSPAELTGVLSPAVAARVTSQARLQRVEARGGEPAYEVLTPGPRLGLGLLPEPSDADVYLDFEGDPWGAGGRGLEYLAGLCDREGRFFTWWAHDAAAEKRLVEDLLGDLVARHRAHPDLHIYHYAPYERTALARLTARYGTREAELDELLRAEAFVDLYAVVRQGVRISKGSYSLKKLEAFYWQQTRTAGDGEVGDALSSVVEYERWMLSGDQGILDAIEEYNRQDVLSTLALHDWLEARRDEAVAAGHDVGRCAAPAGVAAAPGGDPRPPGTGDSGSRDAEASEQEAAEEALAADLRAQGHALLAACVGWHRREARPAWWEYFRFGRLLTDELVADPKALGGLGAPEHVGDVLDSRGRASSKIWRYPMPTQDFSGRRGDTLPCVDTLARLGDVHDLDPVAGWVEFKRGARSEPLAARGAGVPAPIADTLLRESIQRTGRQLLAGQQTLATRLVAPVVPAPADLAARVGESAADVVVRVGSGLDGQVLAVQGPPGTGKTTAAARLVRALLDEGLSVGVTALSHAVIVNLLEAVDRPAWRKVGERSAGRRVVRLDAPAEPSDDAGAAAATRAGGSIVAGAGGGGRPEATADTERTGIAGPAGADPASRHQSPPPGAAGEPAAAIVGVAKTARIAEGLAQREVRLVGGTAWLWAHPDLEGSVDVLVIDEAGQFSLANAVAVAPAARRGVVLLGDPQQLTQPTQAAHPDGGGVSALEHLLAGHDTIPADRGVFLDRTWRMHPDIAGFVSELSYEGRLAATPGRERQRVDAPGALPASGLAWVPCPHTGRVADSPEEAQVVARLVEALLRGTFTDHDGRTRPMTARDVLVVAPFNAHVARLRAVLPAQVRVGTVDRFQGRQAPVVVYAMASSSAELAPRGVSFLYDTHRLNVAISRAQALAVVVGSPTLLDAAVSTPEQLRSVNALCRFVEEAATIDAAEGVDDMSP